MGILSALFGYQSEQFDGDGMYDNRKVYVKPDPEDDDESLVLGLAMPDREIDEEFLTEQGFEFEEDNRGFFRRVLGL